MKKALLILVVLFLLGYSACSDQKGTAIMSALPSALPNAPMSQTPEPFVTFEPWEKYENEQPMVCFDMSVYQSIDELIERSDYIDVTTVLYIEVFENNEFADYDQNAPLQETMIKYTVRIDSPIKGGLTQDSTVAVWQTGWRYKGINIWHPDMPPLEYDKTYLLSFYKCSPFKTLDVDFYVGMPFESYPEIRDGKLYPHPNSQLFSEGQSSDIIISSIKQNVDTEEALQEALISLTAVQGAERLASQLTDYQAPVRQLTSDEMKPFIDFAGNDVVKETAGSELINGDIFIWLKTEDLSKRQQADLKTALATLAEQIAEVRDWGYEVFVTPCHSLICLARGEDRYTIGENFNRIISDPSEKK